MTSLTVRVDELILALEDQSPGVQNFLDRRTGEVLPMFEEAWDEEDARRMESEPGRFLRIEPVPSWVGYNIMSDFVETLPENEVRRALARALQQRSPFRRFKEVLLNHASEREDWFRFHEQAFLEIIRQWLQEEGVEAVILPLQSQT